MKKQSFLMAGLLVLTSMRRYSVWARAQTPWWWTSLCLRGWQRYASGREYRVQNWMEIQRCFDSLLGRESVGLGDHPRGGGKGAAIRIEAGLTVTAIATSFRRSGRRIHRGDNSRYRARKKNAAMARNETKASYAGCPPVTVRP